MSHTCPPIPFPPPPPTSNTLSSRERSALIRSSRKLAQILGDVPRVSEDEAPVLPSRLSSDCAPTRTSPTPDTKSIWHKRKPTHLPPLLKLQEGTLDASDSPESIKSPVYHRLPSHSSSVLSSSPSILYNAPSTASGVSSDAPSGSSQRRTRLERIRHKLGRDVPTTAVFPTAPTTVAATPTTPAPPRHSQRPPSLSKRTARARTRSVVPQAEDTRSIALSISSDESVHTVTFTTRIRSGSPRPPRTRPTYHTGALPPLPPIPSHLLGNGKGDKDDEGLLRPRPKMAAGSMLGGADFKAARRAKREGRTIDGMADPWEMIEMVGFRAF